MKYKLEEIVDVTMGQSPKSMYYNTERKGYPFLQGNRTFGFKYPTFDIYTTVMTKSAKAGDVIMSVRAPVGDINITPIDMCLGRGVCSLRMKNGNQEFLFYMMKYYIPYLLKKESGTVFGSVNRNDINGLEVDIPEDVQTQKKIARYLEMIDDKIELNNKINENLLEQMKVLYKSYFVNFEPFNGIMPSDWKEYKLSNFLPVITGKKNANISSKSGSYPFFSCSQDIAWADEYSFEGNAILVAGNGDFNVKFYNGKFEAYQRTYVLIPYNPRYTAWLFYVVKYNLNKITLSARGSVIKFITKGNLENFSFYAPRNLKDLGIIDLFNATNCVIAANREESANLSKLRDTLLPKLMTGELDVSSLDI
ncbi:MAG: type I restriction endonuclease subunit R [Clostridiales bacterium]|nr:MAG: type I restriction endonuclease subunit R [Clostridiales bacterium]